MQLESKAAPPHYPGPSIAFLLALHNNILRCDVSALFEQSAKAFHSVLYNIYEARSAI